MVKGKGNGRGFGSADDVGPARRQALSTVNPLFQPREAKLVREKEREAATFLRRRMPEQAERIYRELIRKGMVSESVFVNLATTCAMTGRHAEVVEHLDQALLLNPLNTSALHNLGVARRELGQHEQAAVCFGRALEQQPGNTKILVNYADALWKLGKLEEAITTFEQVLALDAKNAVAHMDIGQLLLLTGQFDRGWREYEWRLRIDGCRPRPGLASSPAWEPTSPSGRLLLWGEQGVGDQVMFCSMLKAATDMADELLVQVDRRLLPLMERSFRSIPFHDLAVVLPTQAYDTHLSLGSLGLHVSPHGEGFASKRRAFLLADPERSRRLRGKLAGAENLLCGISWDSQSKTGALKTIPLASLANALVMPEIQFVSLQYGPVSEEINSLRRATGITVAQAEGVDVFGDLDGLAALIDACDLVISISNTTVHLAGALGKPTWVLLHKIPDWRWGLHGEDCLWYPELRLFRQRVQGEWEETLQRIRGSLVDLVERREHAAYR